VQGEVGAGGEREVCCAEALAEGAVAAGGGEVALGVEGDVGGVGYESGEWGLVVGRRRDRWRGLVFFFFLICRI
jgi:hypothetical protein